MTGRTSGRVDVSRLTTRSGQTGTRTTRRSRVGAGVIEIPPMASADPSTVVMADPSVPENRRYCTQCDSPVGRGQAGRPGRTAGFCPNCGDRFDFTAKLKAGDLVAGQYDVGGALAHGGMGWIYLARDRNVSGRWCVLKGLLDTADPDAAEAAVAEQRFLAEVRHPAIVGIHNFVQHEGQGYIVMEYVGGPSLKQLTKRRREAGEGPMPVTEAAAYLHAVLPAIGYLHDHGLIYCDFKPDNVIHEGDAVKLIDLGGVRRWDDTDAAIFGTIGYQAPEVPKTGPTVASDLYTVGRALAVLVLDWPGWTTTDVERLPDRAAHDVLVEHDCLWRFLERACAPDPAERFRDADEMADALHGVLCQVAAAVDGNPRPRTSTRYSPPRPRLDPLGWQALPSPLMPNHPRIANRVAGVAEGDPEAVARMVQVDEELSWADIAAVARAHCELGQFAAGRLGRRAARPDVARGGRVRRGHRQRPVVPARRVGAGRGRRSPGGAVLRPTPTPPPPARRPAPSRSRWRWPRRATATALRGGRRPVRAGGGHRSHVGGRDRRAGVGAGPARPAGRRRPRLHGGARHPSAAGRGAHRRLPADGGRAVRRRDRPGRRRAGAHHRRPGRGRPTRPSWPPRCTPRRWPRWPAARASARRSAGSTGTRSDAGVGRRGCAARAGRRHPRRGPAPRAARRRRPRPPVEPAVRHR